MNERQTETSHLVSLIERSAKRASPVTSQLLVAALAEEAHSDYKNLSFTVEAADHAALARIVARREFLFCIGNCLEVQSGQAALTQGQNGKLSNP